MTDVLKRSLFDGEEILERVSVEGGEIAVTTHRVLAHTPESDGKKFHQADLPNVEGVHLRRRGNARIVERVPRLAVYGVLLLFAGVAIRRVGIFESLGSVDTSGAPSIGNAYAFVDTVVELFGLLGDALLYGGVVLVAVSAVLVAVYVYTRETVVTVEASGDDFHVPAGEEGAEAVSRIDGRLTKT